MSIKTMSLENSNNKPKRCVCISCFNHYETRISYIRNFLEARGIETIYITSNYNHFEKKYFEVDYPRTIQVSVPKYKKNISLSRIVSQITFSIKTYKNVKILSPDIVYCMFPPNTLISFISHYSTKHTCKVVYDGYDMWPESLPVGGLIKKILYPCFWTWKHFRDGYIEKGNLVLAVSQAMVDSVKIMWPKVPVKLLLPGINVSNLPSYTYTIKDSISFCYLGNINFITDIELLVNLFDGINKQKKVVLHIIGKGQKLDELLSALDSKKIGYVLHGVVMDSKEKGKIFSVCNLGVNLPREEIRSGMSLKSVEYMSVGLPFVNSGIEDNWNIVRDCKVGINIKRDDIQKSVNDILQLSGEDLVEMSKNCLTYTKKRFMSQKLDEILSEVL